MVRAIMPRIHAVQSVDRVGPGAVNSSILPSSSPLEILRTLVLHFLSAHQSVQHGHVHGET